MHPSPHHASLRELGAAIVLYHSLVNAGQYQNWLSFDKVIWDNNGIPELEDKLPRRKPSGLDAAFAVLGNNQVVPELVSRIRAIEGVPFRDGYFYQHNLAAVRNVIDRQAPAAWQGSIYAHWLAALRELSAPTTLPQFPECMRTRAWAMKTLNTQLASGTELRHDTVLYAKQSYTEPLLCVYPYGYVEPRANFWQRLAVMARESAGLIQQLPSQGVITIVMAGSFMTVPQDVDLARVKSQELQFLSSLASTLDLLRAISEKELAQQPLTQAENSFLAGLMEDPEVPYVKQKQYSGWYPRLFYKNILANLNYGENEGSDKWDALVTDVHTDAPDLIHGDPGAIIHEAVGNVHLLMLAVDCGPDRMVYAGPVHSYFEFETPVDVRKTDSEWKAQVKQGQRPPHPEWTGSYLVPGLYSVPPGID